MNWREAWPAFALMIFAVASGQIGRLGRRYERGDAVGRRQVIVELTMLPAFAALGGALAQEYRWPVWMILLLGIGAGWLGFGTFRVLMAVWRAIVRQTAGGDDEPKG